MYNNSAERTDVDWSDTSGGTNINLMQPCPLKCGGARNDMEEKLKLSPESISELFGLISRSENSWDNFSAAQDNVISCRKAKNYKCCAKDDCPLIKITNKEYDRMRDDESKLASWVRANAVEIAASLGATKNECGPYIKEKAERNIKKIGYEGSYLLALASELGIII